MPKYLYVFAYQTLEQQQATVREPGSVEESSAAVFIEASTPEEAMKWGQAVAGQFASKGLCAPWNPDKFANWIEICPEREYPPDILARLPIVTSGSHPEPTALVR